MESGEVLICADCGCTIEDPSYSYELKNGRIVCDDCIDNYSMCDDCGKYVSETTRVDGLWVCDECLEDESEYFCCDCCEEYHRTRYLWGDADDRSTICDDCRDEYYATCCDCNRVYLRSDMTWDDNTEEYYCADCEARHSKAIHDYDYKPIPKCKTSAHDEFVTSESIKELLFGIELEVDDGECAGDTAEEICELSEDIYCKHDGSLDSGFEIVSHPCTLEYHTNSMGWEDICGIALNNRFKSHDTSTCGLHIHVGRWQLGNDSGERDRTTAKIILLVDRHWANIAKFTRREEKRLEQWAKRPNILMKSIMDETLVATLALGTKRDGRYQAVNITNSNTVEFRMFRGTLKPETILASLQLTSNICLYAKNHSVAEVLASQWDDITSYEKYSELSEYLKAREITGDYIEAFVLKSKIGVGGFIGDDKTRPFKVGDRVVIVNSDGYDVDALGRFIGEEATIVSESESERFDFGIDFGFEAFPLHNLINRLSDDTGYWVHENNLALA